MRLQQTQETSRRERGVSEGSGQGWMRAWRQDGRGGEACGVGGRGGEGSRESLRRRVYKREGEREEQEPTRYGGESSVIWLEEFESSCGNDSE